MDRRKAAAAAATTTNQTSSRKRRRKLSNTDVYEAATGEDTQSTVGSASEAFDMVYAREYNVIDRVLDAAKYSNDSTFSLYELCRDWVYAGTTIVETMRLNENLFHERARLAAALGHSPNSQQIDETKSNEYVYKLPDANDQEREVDINTEVKELNEKLGETVRQRQANDLEIVKSLNVDDPVFQANALLKLHVDRWKTVRREWIQLYNRSNSRYKQSEDVLKSIFEELQ